MKKLVKLKDQPMHSGAKLTFTAQEAGSIAAQIASFDTPQSLFTSYVTQNIGAKIQNSEILFKIFSAACEIGHNILPNSIRDIVCGKDVLDFGCGTTLYGAAFRAVGARSYVGHDPVIDLSRRKFRSRLLKTNIDVGFSLEAVLLHIPQIEYYQDPDIIRTRTFDIIVLHNVTEQLHEIETWFSHFHDALKPGGYVWFLHTNFHSWSGHQQQPKSLKEYDPTNPEHIKYSDWAHLACDVPPDHAFNTKFNKIRVAELQDLTKRYFSIVEWNQIEENKAVQARLTPEISRRYKEFSRSELLTKSVICLARKAA